MRLLLIIFAVLSQTAALNVQAQTSEDMILQARLEQKSLSWLIDKTRLILANSHIDDKLNAETTIDKDPVFTMDELSKDPEFVAMRDMMSKVFKVDLKNAVIRLRIPKIQYKIDTIHANPLAMNIQDPVLNLKVQAILKGVYVKLTQGLQADFMIPNPTTKVLESYLTATLDPVSIDIPQTIEPLNFEVNFEAKRDQEFHYALKSYNLDTIPPYVDRNQKLMTILAGVDQKGGLTAEHIKVNPIIVRLNNLTRSVNFDTFKPVLQKKMPQIITNVLSLLGTSLRNSIGPKILTQVFSSSMKSDLIVANTNLYTRFATALFSQPESNQLSLGVQGDLCTAETYNRYHEQCQSYEPKPEPIRTISVADKQKGLEELKDVLARGNADVALSISEEYVNRLLRTTINAKLWDDMLTEDHLAIGPKGVFVIFNKKTQNPELFLDLLYLGDKGIQKLFVNPNNPIHFPLRMSTSLGFTLKDEVPYLTIKTEKLLSDINEIIYGIPEYDLTTKMVPLLKKKIGNMVIKMASKLEGKNAVQMDIPVFKGLGLEKTSYEVSPYGRLNLYFKL
jgi:hypothetical protein